MTVAHARALLIVFAAASLGWPAAAAPAVETFATEPLRIETGDGPRTFTVELAVTSAQQEQGLMFRRRLARDKGMLFVHRAPRRAAMWMKNTLIPLDMVFIGGDRRITRIVERTVPYSEETIGSGGPVIAVLELGGGTASRLGIHVGDRVVSPSLGPPN